MIRIKTITKKLLTAAMLLVTSFTWAQTNHPPTQKNAIGFSYQKIDIGRGLQVDYTRRLGENWQVKAGLYIHFNTLPRDDQNHSYYNRGWAEEWYNHLGLNLSVQRSIVNYKQSAFFAFYNTHLLRTGFRDKIYDPRFGSNGQITSYVLNQGFIFDPLITWEHSLGFGISTHLSRRVGFFIRGGVGVAVFYDENALIPGFAPILGSYIWEGMGMMSTGFFYTF